MPMTGELERVESPEELALDLGDRSVRAEGGVVNGVEVADTVSVVPVSARLHLDLDQLEQAVDRPTENQTFDVGDELDETLGDLALYVLDVLIGLVGDDDLVELGVGGVLTEPAPGQRRDVVDDHI